MTSLPVDVRCSETLCYSSLVSLLHAIFWWRGDFCSVEERFSFVGVGKGARYE